MGRYTILLQCQNLYCGGFTAKDRQDCLVTVAMIIQEATAFLELTSRVLGLSISANQASPVCFPRCFAIFTQASDQCFQFSIIANANAYREFFTSRVRRAFNKIWYSKAWYGGEASRALVYPNAQSSVLSNKLIIQSEYLGLPPRIGRTDTGRIILWLQYMAHCKISPSKCTICRDSVEFLQVCIVSLRMQSISFPLRTAQVMKTSLGPGFTKQE